MLASRVLPPIVRPSPPLPPTPVATFFNVPRRYVKSNMQVGDNSPSTPMDDAKPSRSLRKSGRIQDSRSAPISSPVERTKRDELPSPALTSPRTTRKRLASVVEVVDGEDVVENDSPIDAPPSATSTGSLEFSGHVCLCQPEPKIPRPRNAFILYRQHHQQAIIARNPGLNNPDISKIIGEQWKAESEETKKIWQDLAQEEKARHHEQYPDYRYQPRRVGKPGSSPLNPSGQHTTVDKYRCPRCGGRSIKTPTSPFLDTSSTTTLPPPNISEGLTPTTRYLPMMSNLSLESPVRRRGHGPSNLSNIQVTSAMREDSVMYSPLTPNKKRRFDYGPPPSGNGRRPDIPHYPQYARRDSLPPIQVRYSPPNSAGMPQPRTPRESRRNSVIELGPPPQSSSPRTVEEILSAFPYPNKIKLLGRIIPPYKEPGLANLGLPKSRGAIIAVEGDELGPVKELSEWLNEYLIKQREYKPRIAEPPKSPEDNDKDVSFEDYLDLIKEWHGKSKEMIKYITAPTLPSEDTTMSDKGSDKETTDRKDSVTPPDSPGPNTTTKPVIILPTFQLQASVAYASRIPIQDAYSATDHWQWMATLWRGTVGPDLTIYVKTYDAKEGYAGAKPDMDEAVRCLTVFREKDGKFVDADLRRVGFEVNEWIKGMSATKVA
ncbi:Nn.00g093610.m01.CDS01 [Neocucurbitaria sp. VM-36]